MAQPTLEEILAQIAALQQQAAAMQSGSGGQAVGRYNVVAGERAIAIGRDFNGNIYQGAPPKNEAEALALYRRMLVLSCRQLPLRGFDVGASDPTRGGKQMDLDQVYVSLDTTAQFQPEEEASAKGPEAGSWLQRLARRIMPASRGPMSEELARRAGGERGEAKPLPALLATALNLRLVLLGDPGSGKSTFVNHLSLCLALHGLEPSRHWCDGLAGWPKEEAGLLPVPVILRDFARSLPAKASPADAITLWDFITAWLQRQRLVPVAEPLEQALETGRAIVLLDGLDEIVTPAHRQFVRDAVLQFARRYAKSRFVVTCRTLSYQQADWQLPDFPAFTLAPFDAPKIDRFIAAWFGDLQRLGVVKPDEAMPLTRSLQDALRRADLWPLAANPLLLTVMALVHTHKGRLPDARALLYEDTVDILLWRWEQLKLACGTDTPGLRQLLVETGRSDVDLKRTLWRMAYEAHRVGGHEERLADLGEHTLQMALAELHPAKSHDWARKVIETIRHRAGLLLERLPQVYTFPHRTFQEYLAGAHLASQARFASEAAKLVEAGAFWREVILLAVGKLVYLSGDTDKPLALVAELCPRQGAATPLGWQQAWLAGEVLGEMGLARVREGVMGRDLHERVQGRLVELLAAGALTRVERAKAGTVLGKLGDPRRGVGVKNGLPDFDWIEIPAGPFIMGSKQGETRYVDETPQFECRLITQPYRISRYPVTVAQYRAFVDAGGYADLARRWWTPEGWKWKEENKVSGPEEDQPAFQTSNHPRVGVSWFEAVAFCRWLSEQLQQQIRLPSEAEWERAARHTDGRAYPWGEGMEDLAQRCNMAETGIGHTSAVGLFPGGLAQCGAADMAGNVWEWCRTKWRGNYTNYEQKVDDALDGTDRLVLRGGSWGNLDPETLRCSFRFDVSPVSRSQLYGFRCVWWLGGSAPG